MTENNYPPGTRVRRTVVTEGVVMQDGTGRTDDGAEFNLHHVYTPGTVTVEVLAPAEPGVGAVIAWENGYVATRSPATWMVSGSGVSWKWEELIYRGYLGPNFGVLREGAK